MIEAGHNDGIYGLRGTKRRRLITLDMSASDNAISFQWATHYQRLRCTHVEKLLRS